MSKYEQIIDLSGALPGPTLTLLAGVHGNELPGLLALENLARQLTSIKRGRLIMLYGNPLAIQSNVRQTDQNLNRMFSDDLPPEIRASYEYERALFLRQYLDQSDICLDLHASSTPDSPVFAITEPPAFDLLTNLPLSTVLSNIDPFEPGGTDGYMNRQGRLGICVECGYLADRAAAGLAEETALRLLMDLDMVDRRLDLAAARGPVENARKREYFKVTDLYRNNSGPFILKRPYADFELIQVNEVVGHDGGEPVQAKQPFHILFATDRDQIGAECYLSLEKQPD